MANQESLSEIQEKYLSLVENLSVGVYRNTPGPKGHFLEANSAIVAMFEAKSKEEFMKHNVSDLYQNPEERKSFVTEILKNGEVKNKEIRLITLKGKKIIGSVTAVMKKNKNGDIYFDGIVEDITTRKGIENELINYRNSLEERVKVRTNELENTKIGMLNVMEDLETARKTIELEKVKDEAILASIGEGIIAIDNNKKITVVNRAAEEMLESKKGDLLGKLITILPLEDQDGNPIPFDRRPTQLALTTGKAINITYFSVRKDKTKFPIAVNVTPIQLDGKTIGAVDTFRDITREMEIDRAKSEFVSLASHQLRTPLGISKWYMEAIMTEKYFQNAPKIGQEYLQEVYKNNERLLLLVRDLLSISRIDQGKVRNTPQCVSVIQIVKTVIHEMEILALKYKVTLNLVITKKDILNIFIDPLRLQEVVENLVTNAITYSNIGGKVTITIDQKKDDIVIIVKDNGVGISHIDKKKLFTKFFRSEEALAKNTEGSGLGLYLVKSYVDGWGGNISVKSKLGKGSTFFITLPIKTKEGDTNK